MTKKMSNNTMESESSIFFKMKNEEVDIFRKCMDKMDFQCFGEIFTSDRDIFLNIERSLKRPIVTNDQYLQYFDELYQKCQLWLEKRDVLNKKYLPSFDAGQCAFDMLQSLMPAIIQLENAQNVIVEGIYHFNPELDFEDFLLMFKPKHQETIMNEIDFSKPDSNISEQLLKSLLKFDGVRAN